MPNLERIGQAFKTALPSGDVLLSSHWLRHVLVEIAGRELSADLVVLNLVEYDVILGMDFLGKYNATIDCRKKKVVFQPEGE